MRISPHIIPALVLVALASCTKSRRFTYVNGQPVPPFDMPIVELQEDARLDEVLAGNEHSASWRALEDFPLAANDTGLMLRLTNGRTIALRLQQDEELRAPTAATDGSGQELLHIERAIGTCTMTIEGNGRGADARGKLRLQFDGAQLTTLRQSGWQPTAGQCLQLLVNDTSAATVVAYKQAANDASLHLAMALADRDVESATFGQFASVTEFSDEDVIKLLMHGVDLQTAIDWHAIGRNLTVAQIIYAKQRGFGPPLANEWQAASTDLTLEQIYWAKARGLSPDYHTEWAEAGKRLSLEDLYWVRARGVQPNSFREWRDAGFELDHQQLYWAKARGLNAVVWREWHDAGKDLNLEQLYEARSHGLDAGESRAWRDAGQDLSLAELRTARSRGLRASVAAEWRKLGFTWSVDELSQLRARGITPQFAERFVDPKFDNPTLDELYRYRLRNLKPADVNGLRRRRTGG